MADITKQSYEEFRIHVDFGLNMESGEYLLPLDSQDSSLADVCDVKCWDKDGNIVTDTMLDISTLTIIDGNATDDEDNPGSGMTNAALQVLIRGGSETDGSPYKFTFYGVTTLNPPNKWEKDITMRIRER